MGLFARERSVYAELASGLADTLVLRTLTHANDLDAFATL